MLKKKHHLQTTKHETWNHYRKIEHKKIHSLFVGTCGWCKVHTQDHQSLDTGPQWEHIQKAVGISCQGTAWLSVKLGAKQHGKLQD